MKFDNRLLGASAVGSVAGAWLWKQHRVWGFILGGILGTGLYRVIKGGTETIGTSPGPVTSPSDLDTGE